MKTLLLEDILPICAVEQSSILSKQMDLSFGMEIDYPPIFSLCVEEIERMHKFFCRALEELPSNATVHLRRSFRRVPFHFCERHRDLLEKHSDMHFLFRPVLKSRSLLFITFRNQPEIEGSLLLKVLRKGSPIRKEHLKSIRENEYLEKVEKFLGCLECIPELKIRILGREDFLGNDKNGLIEQALFGEEDHPSALEDISFEKGEMLIGKRHISILSVANLEGMSPSLCPWGQPGILRREEDSPCLTLLSPLGCLFGEEHILNVFIILTDTSRELSLMERSIRHKHSLELFDRENPAAALEQEEFVSKLTREGGRISRVHLNVTLWDENPEILSRKQSDAAAAFAQLGLKCHRERNRLLALYLAAIPGAEGLLGRNQSMTLPLSQASMMLVQESVSSTTLSFNGLRLRERLTGNPLEVDFTDEPMRRGIISNRNKFVLGASGSGKSFFMNHLLHHYYMLGYHIVVLDMGGSYRNLEELIRWQSGGRDGIEIRYGASTRFSLNPFSVTEREDTEKLDSILDVILSLWKRADDPVSRYEETFLQESISLYVDDFLKKGGRGSLDGYCHFLEYDYATRLKKRNLSGKEFPLMEFLAALAPYTKGGQFQSYIDSSNISDLLSNRFILFDMEKVKDNRILRNLLMLSVTECYMEKLRKLKGRRKVIVMDEVWKMICNERMADYLKYLFKTVRKYEGEAIVLSQEVEDITDSPIVKQTIVSNSDLRILFDLKHNRQALEKISGLLSLSKKARGEITSLNCLLERNRDFREVWIGFSTGESRVYAVEVSDMERVLFSSDEKTRERMWMLRKLGWDPIRSAERILEEEKMKNKRDESEPEKNNRI